MMESDYGVEVAESNSLFKLQSYWEKRFEKEESYEWLASWRSLASLMRPHIKPSDRILIVGCGNSSFSADIYDDGFHNITNIDFASSVIERMSLLHKETRPGMDWVVMDMTNLSFPDGAFDVVLDKAAMDAMVVDEGDVWDPEQAVIDSADAMCQSISRVMKSDSKFLQISFAQPHFRTKYLMGHRADGTQTSPYEASKGHSKRYNWDLDCSTIDSEGGCLNSFLYVMTRAAAVK